MSLNSQQIPAKAKHLSAELFIATGCSHCPVVMAELSQLLKNGKLGSLVISNIAVDTERAGQFNIRSVPTFIFSGPDSSMLFSGKYTPAEIQKWTEIALTENSMIQYIESFLEQGELMAVTQAIQFAPETFTSVISMLKDEETSMHVRIGLDALLENFSNTEILQQHVPALLKLATEKNVRLQIDALHYLALSGDKNIKAFLEEKTLDDDEQIKNAATEALETLSEITEN